ncbi:hypothetical protein FSP39_012156 [Pinctada imbricata]|uniref:VWFA domain-containing protein n=1 Tax=Pinctada imbricata TaxID=66713 RepID=A0AA88YD60_PINIB|nr:hypothetical protein FSP39_012156 [Pinctada imbricata]
MNINVSEAKTSTRFRVMHLDTDVRFNDVPVNTSMSTIHVPTNVFDKAPVIQNGVKWSAVLDSQFVDNERKYKDLTWQYFCSSDGFLRIYPGMKWPRDNRNGNIDMYDCRVRNWYIQASTSPKNILILIDTSGSMKGLRMKIARKTIEKILDTLSDDDHFNIITYTDEPSYVEECFNGTMWPSNSENKKAMFSHFDDMEVKNVANLSKALTVAFDLFDKERRQKRKLCNKAIMLINDGVPETYDHLFNERNWKHNKTVRVFSFLIGREVQDNSYANWMACANKGYYVHISTIADVQESIQHYMRVLSRPMVISRADHTIWTPLYADYTTEVSSQLTGGLQYVTSVARPVYDRRNETFTRGHLLGVMGSDVPINHLMNLVPKDMLGSRSFAFLTTRHGYVVSHPQLRPTYIKTEKTDNQFDPYNKTIQETVLRTGYNNYDITEMMYTDDKKKLQQFRRELLRGFGKVENIKLKVPFENEKRIAVDSYNLYFKKIKGTGFSLGIAVPSRGIKYPIRRNANRHKSGKQSSVQVCPGNLTKKKNLQQAWCQVAASLPEIYGEDFLYVPVKERNEKLYNFFRKCPPSTSNPTTLLPTDLSWIWKLTDGNKPNDRGWWHTQANLMETGSREVLDPRRSKQPYDETFEKHGIQNLFCGTRSGVTAFMETGIDDSSEVRAVLRRNKAGMGRGKALSDMNMTSVTATMPITNKVRGNTAVVGLNMQYNTFREKIDKFMNDEFCDPRAPNSRCFSCHNSSIISCYLLDLNGYIIYNNVDPERVGVFMSGDERDGDLMSMLVFKKIFYRILFENTVYGMTAPQQVLQRNPDQICQTAHSYELKEQYFYKYHVTHEFGIYCDVEVEEKPCHKETWLYHANVSYLRRHNPIMDSIVGCEFQKGDTVYFGNRSYYVQFLENTNLIFLAAAADCNCSMTLEFNEILKPNITGREITYILS